MSSTALPRLCLPTCMPGRCPGCPIPSPAVPLSLCPSPAVLLPGLSGSRARSPSPVLQSSFSLYCARVRGHALARSHWHTVPRARSTLRLTVGPGLSCSPAPRLTRPTPGSPACAIFGRSEARVGCTPITEDVYHKHRKFRDNQAVGLGLAAAACDLALPHCRAQHKTGTACLQPSKQTAHKPQRTQTRPLHHGDSGLARAKPCD